MYWTKPGAAVIITTMLSGFTERRRKHDAGMLDVHVYCFYPLRGDMSVTARQRLSGCPRL